MLVINFINSRRNPTRNMDFLNCIKELWFNDTHPIFMVGGNLWSYLLTQAIKILSKHDLFMFGKWIFGRGYSSTRCGCPECLDPQVLRNTNHYMEYSPSSPTDSICLTDKSVGTHKIRLSIFARVPLPNLSPITLTDPYHPQTTIPCRRRRLVFGRILRDRSA